MSKGGAMQWFKIRPTFDVYLACDRQAVIDWFAIESKRYGNREIFLMHGEYGELHLPKSVHRLWSPHLSFYIQQRHDEAMIHGRFAPRVDVWTCVWIAYLLAIFSAFFAAVLAYSQWFLGQTPIGFWIMMGALAILLGIYLIAHIGQQWSADQMVQLRQEFDALIARAVEEIPVSETATQKLVTP